MEPSKLAVIQALRGEPRSRALRLLAWYDNFRTSRQMRKANGFAVATQALAILGFDYFEFSDYHIAVKAHGAEWNLWPTSGKWSFKVKWESHPVHRGLVNLLADIENYGATKAAADAARPTEDDKRARYRRAWERWGEVDSHEERLEQEQEMDHAQNEFTHEEWKEFKRTLPGFGTTWEQLEAAAVDTDKKL